MPRQVRRSGDWYDADASERAEPAPELPRLPAPEAHVYLLCFASTPYHHARHYIGATGKPVAERLKAHRGIRADDGSSIGRPAKLVQAMLRAGGDFVLGKSWDFETTDEAYAFERRLKRNGGGSQACPICRPGNRMGEGKGWAKGAKRTPIP